MKPHSKHPLYVLSKIPLSSPKLVGEFSNNFIDIFHRILSEKMAVILQIVVYVKELKLNIIVNKSPRSSVCIALKYRTEYKFTIGQHVLNTVKCYRYLGVIFVEHLDYTTHCEAISKGAGRALGGIISKVYNMKDFSLL